MECNDLHAIAGVGCQKFKSRDAKTCTCTRRPPLRCWLASDRDVPCWDIDVGVITLSEDIPLHKFPYSMKKAQLASPSNTACVKCTSSCGMTLDVSGWGDDPSDHDRFGTSGKLLINIIHIHMNL